MINSLMVFLNRFQCNLRPMNSVISGLRSKNVKGKSRVILFFIIQLRHYNENNFANLAVSCSKPITMASVTLTDKWKSIITDDSDQGDPYGSPKNLNFKTHFVKLSTITVHQTVMLFSLQWKSTRTNGVSKYLLPDLAWRDDMWNWFDAR